jgi:6-phosphogluconolactonase
VAEAPERVDVAENPELARRAADWVVELVGRAVKARGRCSLALAGGSTPRPIYADLASRAPGVVAWDKVDIFFGDERAVPPNHADSNYRMAREALIDPVFLRDAQVHRMEAERADRDRAAAEYGRALPERLDVLILGMGPDGHTASLFPGAASLDEATRRVIPVTGPKPPPERLTITAPVIHSARSVMVVATGRDKAGMVARAIEGEVSPKEVPIRLARRGAWFLDPAAAGGLTRRNG